MKKELVFTLALFSLFSLVLLANPVRAYYDYYNPGYYTYYEYNYPNYYSPYCYNPYGSEGEIKCFANSLYKCQNSYWYLQRPVECCESADCVGSQDSDGNNPLIAGTCTESTVCMSNQCSKTIHNDMCYATTLLEYYNYNGICISQSYDCNQYCKSAGFTSGLCSGSACVCNQAPSCTNECYSGEKRCSSQNSFQTCGNYDNDNCLEWGSTQSCSYGQNCENGECRQTCTNECYSSERRCSDSNHYQTCGQYDTDSCLEWGSSQYCQYGCENGQCITTPPCTNECYSGQTQCSGSNSYRTCGQYDSDSCLEWGSPLSCQYGCENGQCITAPSCTDECYSGEKRCSSQNAFQTCGNYDNDNCAEWGSTQSCSYGQTCQNGQCIQQQTCQNTDTSCGQWPNCNNCNANDGFSGQRYCSNNNVYQNYRDYYCGGNSCNNRDEQMLVETCQYGCSNGQCTYQPSCTDECISGERQCSSQNSFQTCGNYDNDQCTEWGSTQSCSYDETCDEGQCIYEHTCGDECYLGERRCSNSNSYQVCGNYDNDNCLEWGASQYCSFGRQCSNGYCEQQQCRGTDTSCGSDYCFNCNNDDGYVGSSYCKGDDVYRRYRDYFCSWDACDFREYERLAEDCSYGCDNDHCISASRPTSKITSPSYGSQQNNDFYVYADDYSNIGLQRCEYKVMNDGIITRDWTSRTCDSSFVVTVGDNEDCRNRGTNECTVYVRAIDNRGYYSDAYSRSFSVDWIACLPGWECYDGNTKGFRLGDCTWTNLIDCDYGCSHGTCIQGSTPTCNSYCTEWSNWNIVDGFSERRRTCFTQSVVNGVCAVVSQFEDISRESITPAPKTTKEKVFQFDVDISHSLQNKEYRYEDKRLTNGVLFGSNEIIFDVTPSFVKYISFTVTNTNNYGSLNVYMNSTLIYSGYPPAGTYNIAINQFTTGKLRIVAGTSGWRMWAPTIYDLTAVRLVTDESAAKESVIGFDLLGNEYSGFLSAKLELTPVNATIVINGKIIQSNDLTKDFFKSGENTVAFLPNPNTSFKGKAVLRIKYEE